MVFANDYYPFGMAMPERSFDSPKYRYGFNGKEKDEDDEWGSLTHYDYGFRIYNPGIARFLSVDPLTGGYPQLTPYQFASNRPIDGIDVDGKEWEAYKASQIVKNEGVAALPIITSENGFGPILKASYTLRVQTDIQNFDNLKNAYITNPGILHNPDNAFAEYFPLENPNDGDNILDVGDHMFIDIFGPINDYVRFTDIDVSGNRFYIKAATLLGHTDAGFILFSGSFDEESGLLEFSIQNETTNNIGLDATTLNVGRYAQDSQWKVVLNNVENYIKGETVEKTVTKEVSTQNSNSGDAVKVITENMLTNKSTETYKENKE